MFYCGIFGVKYIQEEILKNFIHKGSHSHVLISKALEKYRCISRYKQCIYDFGEKQCDTSKLYKELLITRGVSSGTAQHNEASFS